MDVMLQLKQNKTKKNIEGDFSFLGELSVWTEPINHKNVYLNRWSKAI